MLRKGLCALALLGLASAAWADPYDNPHFYIGGGFGTSSYEDDDEFRFFNLDDADASGTLCAGYRVTRNVAVELRASKLGEYRVSSLVDSLDVEISALTAHALLILPLGSGDWELFGQAGLGVLKRDVQVDDDTGGVGSLGGGIRWTPTRQFTMGAQLDVYAFTVDGAFGQEFDQGVGTAQLTFAYNFR